MQETNIEPVEQLSGGGDQQMDMLKSRVLQIGSNKDIADFASLYNSYYREKRVILIDGYSQGIAASTQGWESRRNSHLFPKTSFEALRKASLKHSYEYSNDPAQNKRSKLWLESKQIGRLTKTNVAFMYIKGIVTRQNCRRGPHTSGSN